MAHPIVVPRLGWTMEEGVFLEWLKRDGETVRAGDNLFVLEGEKSAQEVESVESGILRIPPDAPPPGTTVAVGAVLAYLVEAGEAPPWETPDASASGVAGTKPAAAGARPPSVSIHDVPARTNDEPAISPRARRVAAELGVAWTTIKGSGATGRIRERDVRAVAGQTKAATRGLVPLSPVRRVIAERMLAGAQLTAPVTLTTRIDATNLVSLRDQFKSAAADGLVPGYTGFFVKLVALALDKHPEMNRGWGDGGLIDPGGIHIGIAVDTEAGLMVPVIREVPSLSLREVAQRASSLVELARARRLPPEQSQGGTFTITNLGMYGIDAFTPILNLPQCAILGMGRIHREPAVHNGEVVPRAMMTLSLTFDHRIVDGGPAARFLNTIREFSEQPAPRLIV